MNKKVVSSVLAGAIAVSSMGISAFAATADKQVKTAGATTYKVSATLAAPEINVTLPGAVSAVVNPYGVAFEMKGQTYGGQGVTSPTYTIKNNTTASAVSVVATATLTVPTKKTGTGEAAVTTPTIKVLTTEGDIATNETSKTKALYACVKGAAPAAPVTADKLPGYEDPTTKKVVADLILFPADDQTEVEGATTLVFEDATLATKEAPVGTPATLMVIPKATAAVMDTDGTTVKTPAKIGYGQFALGGDVTDTKITPWTSADKISINLVLDIGPAQDPTT